MQFTLTDTPAKLTSVTNRIERHGDEEVPAISVGLHTRLVWGLLKVRRVLAGDPKPEPQNAVRAALG